MERKLRVTILPRLFGLSIILSIFFGLIGVAAAVGYGGLGGRPAFPQNDLPKSSDIFLYTLEPGAEQFDAVVVTNDTDAQKSVIVYSADSISSTDGGFACRQLSEQSTGVGTWVRFGSPQSTFTVTTDAARDSDRDGIEDVNEAQYQTNPEAQDTDGDGIIDGNEISLGSDPTVFDQALTESDNLSNVDAAISSYANNLVEIALPQNESLLIPFTVTVPATASPGEQNGCILIQENKSSTGESGIQIATRSGMRLSVTVPGEVDRRLEIVDFVVEPQAGGGVRLHPIVRNTGSVSIDADIRIVVRNIFGKMIQEIEGRYTILPNDEAGWNFMFPANFWGGWYRAELSVAYDTGAETSMSSASGRGITELIGPEKSFLLVPSTEALGILGFGFLALVSFVVAGVRVLRLRRRIRLTWVTYSVKSGDSLQALAASSNVSWRLLARVNSLRPPYQLTPGQKLRVPPRRD